MKKKKNKLIKAFIAFLGGVDVAFSLFIPIGLSIVIINTTTLTEMQSTLLLVAAVMSTLYRAIDFALLRG